MRTRGGSVVVLAFLAVVLVLSLRVHHALQRELSAAREAERAGDPEAAILAYRRAASWYLPLSGAPDEALAAMQRIATQARQQQDAELELSATRAWYSALQSSRVLSVSAGELQAVAAQLASLTLSTAPAAIGDGRSIEQRRNALLRQLTAPPQPRPFGFVLAVLGFACWVGAAFLLPAHGLDIDHQPTTSARRLGTAIVFGFGLFVLGLALA